MRTDPRKLDAAIQRLMFIGLRRCSTRVTRANVDLNTGESWIGPEACGECATYATVRKGRISPRCQVHAYKDAETMGVTVNEEWMIEGRGGKKPL